MPHRLAVPLALLVALLPTGCAARAEGRGGEAVGIGLAADLKRPAMGSVRNGAELAIERLNVEGAGGRRFALRTVGAELSSAVEIATALRDDPTVAGVVGHTDSQSSNESAPVYGDAEHDEARAVVAVSPTSSSPLLSGRSPWLFRVCPSDLAVSRAVARYALDSLKARRAAIVYRNDDFGKGWTRAFADAFEEGGGVVVERDPHLPGMKEWDAYAGYARKLNPDVILFSGSAADAEPFIRSLRAAGVRAPLLGSDAVSELEAKKDEFAGTSYTAFFLAQRPTTEEGRAFVAAYAAKYHALPDQRAALTYDATMLVGRAVLAVGRDRRLVRDYIAEVGRSRSAMRGVTGAIAFDARHDVVNKPVVIATVGR